MRHRGTLDSTGTFSLLETINATKLTAVAMKESYFDVVEVRLASDQKSLEVLRDSKSLSFSEQSWLDMNGDCPRFFRALYLKRSELTPTAGLPGVSVFSPSPANVTVMLRSGAGVEVRLREGTMTTTVLLPQSFKDATLGLLGKMNGDPADDLTLSNGLVVQKQSNPEEVFSFGVSCEEAVKTQCEAPGWSLYVTEILLSLRCHRGKFLFVHVRLKVPFGHVRLRPQTPRGLHSGVLHP